MSNTGSIFCLRDLLFLRKHSGRRSIKHPVYRYTSTQKQKRVKINKLLNQVNRTIPNKHKIKSRLISAERTGRLHHEAKRSSHKGGTTSRDWKKVTWRVHALLKTSTPPRVTVLHRYCEKKGIKNRTRSSLCDSVALTASSSFLWIAEIIQWKPI